MTGIGELLRQKVIQRTTLASEGPKASIPSVHSDAEMLLKCGVANTVVCPPIFVIEINY